MAFRAVAWGVWTALIAGNSLASAQVSSESWRLRPRIDDALNLNGESLGGSRMGDAVFSPDGQALVFTRLRPENSQVTNNFITQETRNDIWIQEKPGEPARNLTNGRADSSGWWRPIWSPDGRRLAFFSSRGGNVTPWVWERATNQMKQVSTDGVAWDDMIRDDPLEGEACRWVDNRRLLCAMFPAGQISKPFTRRGTGAEAAMAAWEKAFRGELTANVINSLEFEFPERRLMLVDVTARTSRLVAVTALDHIFDASSKVLWVSPDGQVVAYIPAPGVYQLPSLYRRVLGYPARIELRRLDGTPIRLARPLPQNILTATLAWSPDGEELAFFAHGEQRMHPLYLYGEGITEVQHEAVASLENPARLWRVNVATGEVRQVATGEIDLSLDLMAAFRSNIFYRDLRPPGFMWAGRELLFRARRVGASPSSPPEWLVLDRDGRTRPLAAEGQTMPDRLEPIGGGAFLGAVDGDVWRLEVPNGTMTNLTAGFALEIASVEGCYQATGAVMATEAGNYVLDLGSGALTALRAPDAKAQLVTVAPATGAAVYQADDRRGTYLWRTDRVGQADALVATNTHRRGLRLGRVLVIEYTTQDGVKLKARVGLPPDYLPGRRYPVFVDVYPTGSITAPAGEVSKEEMLDLQSPEMMVANAMGYVFVHPDTWSGPHSWGKEGKALSTLTNGVMAGVQKLVEMGLADPERVFAWGCSQGGHHVEALVTQTHRFKAAVAECAEPTSYGAGAEHLSFRYSNNPFDHHAGYLLMGPSTYSTSNLPAWALDTRARRNRPMEYVDRVRTPLMIIKNDFDGAPTDQEQFFLALLAQRKPAQLVRYWGDGHGQFTPANWRDSIQRIFAWFDQWGDIARDGRCNLLWEGGRVQSRKGAAPMKPEDYGRCDFFQSSGSAAPAIPEDS